MMTSSASDRLHKRTSLKSCEHDPAGPFLRSGSERMLRILLNTLAAWLFVPLRSAPSRRHRRLAPQETSPLRSGRRQTGVTGAWRPASGPLPQLKLAETRLNSKFRIALQSETVGVRPFPALVQSPRLNKSENAARFQTVRVRSKTV